MLLVSSSHCFDSVLLQLVVLIDTQDTSQPVILHIHPNQSWVKNAADRNQTPGSRLNVLGYLDVQPFCLFRLELQLRIGVEVRCPAE